LVIVGSWTGLLRSLIFGVWYLLFWPPIEVVYVNKLIFVDKFGS
jgi:hypothetical protein